MGTLFNDGKREEFLLLGSIRMDVFDLKIQKLLQKTKNVCDKYFSNCFMNRVIVVCYTAVFSVVTQRSSYDDTKNGCVAD